MFILAVIAAMAGGAFARERLVPAQQTVTRRDLAQEDMALRSLELASGACGQDSTVQRLQDLADAYAKGRGFNGSILVARKGIILLEKGYGWRDRAKRLPNDGQTQFQIASTTKTFTSTVILRLIAANKLALTDKLSRWYPELPYGDSVTIEQLLTHTSGIWDFTRGEPLYQADEQKMISIFRSHPLDFPPGTDWRYSNSNYELLGYIVKRVTGQDYFRTVRATIFEPLGMRSSGFDFTHLSSKEKAVGYKLLTDSMGVADEFSDSSVVFAAGSIYSTVEDLYRWHRGLEDGKVLDTAWQEKAYTKFMSHYGYGWTVDSVGDKKVVSHSGSIAGFGSDFERVPADDICVIVLSNKSKSTFMVQNISQKMLAILYGRPYTLPSGWVVKELPAAELQSYSGSYDLKELNLVFRIWVEDGELFGQSENRAGPRATMEATGNDHFIIKEDEDAEISFVRDASGKIIAMDVKQRGTVKTAKKIK